MDEHEIKMKVLQDLIDEMRKTDGMKLKPKAVEVSVSSVKPDGILDDNEHPAESESQEHERPEESQSLGEHHEPEGDGDELSPEDVSMLEHLLGGDEEEKEHL